jgi:hypothetical protein
MSTNQKDLLDMAGDPAIQQGSMTGGTDLAMSPANAAFEDFWEIKPDRAGSNPKADAKTSFLRLVARGIDAEVLVAAARAWADQERKDHNVGTRFVKTAVAWLNQFGREEKLEASEPRKPKDYGASDAIAHAHGYQWNGEKYVKISGWREEVRRPPMPSLSIEDRAQLFVSRETIWFAELAERHDQSDKSMSYMGKSSDGARSGIWVPWEWFQQLKGRAQERLHLHQLNTPAIPEDALTQDRAPSDADVDFGV